MLFSSVIRQLPVFFFCFFALSGLAQGPCTDCVVALPDTLPADTIFLSPAPDGRVGMFYEGDLSFRVPQTTTPVADEGVPTGIDISKITIETVNNVPPGLTWTASQTEFKLPEETDGCVRFCGTPLAPGLYMIEVVVTARVIVIDQQTSFSIPLLIEPAQIVTEGFTATNTLGCGSVETGFSNSIPSGGEEGFDYFWDFGNGNVSLEENPPAQQYDEPGTYPVSYQAIIDTTGYFLTKVRVTNVTCSDAFNGAPDLQLKVFDSAQNEVYSSAVRRDVRPPQEFSLNLKIGPGDYTLSILDDDEGIFGGDKNCGTYNFNQQSDGNLNDGDAQVEISIFHPVDTINSTDTITVFEQPAAPVIALEEGPYCQGDTILLTSSYEANNQWQLSGAPLPGETDAALSAAVGGGYTVKYTSPDGCQASSTPVLLSFAAPPSVPAPVFENNLIQLSDSTSLPADIRIEWTLNGDPLPDAEGAAFCIQESGRYAVQVTDLQTGCSSSAELEATYDPAFAGCVSNRNAFNALVEKLRLFPNPTAGPVQLELRLKETKWLELQLLDLTGRPLWQDRGQAGPGLERRSLDFTGLPAGIYLLQLRIDGLQRGFRLVLGD